MYIAIFQVLYMNIRNN